MNILHINTEKTWRGGEQQTLYLAKGLDRLGHVSEIVCQPDNELVARAEAQGLKVYPLRMRGEWDLSAVLKLRSIILERPIDIVHMHTSHAHTLGVAAARLSRRALTVVARRVDFSIYRHPLSLSGLKYRFGVDRYVAISHAIKRELVRDGIPGDTIEVVHSGVDLSRFENIDGAHLEKEFSLEPEGPLVGIVAHLAWHKGLENLIDATPQVATQVPGTKIVLVGDGILKQRLAARAQDLNAGRHLVFTGFRTDIPECMNLFDLFVMPSIKEGLCTSILDALASKTPVVASRTGGIPEIVEHMKTGLLVTPGDSSELADAIVFMLKNPELARDMALAGYAKVCRHFSVESMVAGNLGVYERLIARKARREVQH